MIINRTKRADTATFWVNDPWQEYSPSPYASQVHVCEYPTHSNVLGPDGKPLQYADRARIGFDLSRRSVT